MNYNSLSIQYETNCTEISSTKWDSLMKGAVKADVRKVNKLVKEQEPEIYRQLCLEYYNPYNYFRTKKHLVLVHSAIEYFFRIV